MCYITKAINQENEDPIMRKRLICVLLCLVLTLALFACGKAPEEKPADMQSSLPGAAAVEDEPEATETPLTVANLNGSHPKPGSMGKIVPLYDIRVLRDDGTECEDGETGEICIAYDRENPPAGIMMEYYRNPEKTDEAIHDGWYHTGDTAWRDEDNYLWYVGRNDDVIKSSGYRIGPTEIESVLLTHAAVRECAVTGVPDPVRGKAVKATIVLQVGYEGTPELTKELQRYVKQETAPYKFPRIIDYVDALPKTVNGKIRRVAIRKRDEELAAAKADAQDKKDGLI